MWDHDIGFLPVVNADGCVVGVITDRDICMAAYTQGVALSAGKVASAMSQKVISVHPDDSLRAVENTMRQNQIRRVPVLDGTGQPLGIIALADLARHGEETAFRKALEARGVAKTLAAISEPRPHSEAVE
jgi:CBS domain-containing protein